jgi:hypothetical protein
LLRQSISVNVARTLTAVCAYWSREAGFPLVDEVEPEDENRPAWDRGVASAEPADQLWPDVDLAAGRSKRDREDKRDDRLDQH